MIRRQSFRNTPGLIVLFGSGELSPTGRKIHETVLKQLNLRAPVSVGILETPSGFEVNAIHGWPERMELFFRKHLRNYKPVVTRIRAWRRDGEHSTDDPAVVDAILDQDYLYAGAGSPTYMIKHLSGSRAFKNFVRAFYSGTTICLGSAAAVAAGKYALPVYEIFKAGEDIRWTDGLNFLGLLDPYTAVVPHWNNQEGEDFDTTCCWMGRERFGMLQQMLPKEAVIIGIDEQTALIINPNTKKCEVAGIGSVHIITSNRENIFRSGSMFVI